MTRLVPGICFTLLAACTGAPLDAGSTGSADSSTPLAPTTRTTLSVAIDAMAMDADNVYFTSEDGFLYRLARTGTSPPARIAGAKVTGSAFTGALTLDDESLYWTALGDGIASGAVLTVPKTGGSPLVLAGAQGRPTGLAVDSTHVYWANQGPPPPPDGANNFSGAPGILSVPKTGGALTYLATDVEAPDSLTVDATHVIWHEYDAIRRIPKAGGASMTLTQAAIPWTSSNLVVSGNTLYWGADQGVWSLLSVGLGGGQVSTLVPVIDTPGGLLVDGASAWWVIANGTQVGALNAAPIAGGKASPVTAADARMGAMGQGAKLLIGDATAFYWVESWESPALVVEVRSLAR